MEIREASKADGPAIRSVALRSMEASYSLSPGAIEGAIHQWYNQETFEEKIEDDDVQFLVVEIDGEPVAFSESVLVDSRGDIQWLHVAAMYRGEGIGDRLFKATKERLEEGGAETIRGIVIADNNEGNTFYERRGLVKVDETTVEIDGTPFRENIYVDEEQTSVPTIEGAEGQTLYVDKTDADRGSKGAIYTVYTDGRQENRYGYYCGACESIVTAMDTMGAIECDSCGNRVKPTRWDAAYM